MHRPFVSILYVISILVSNKTRRGKVTLKSALCPVVTRVKILLNNKKFNETV